MENKEMVSATTNEQKKVTCQLSGNEFLLSETTQVVWDVYHNGSSQPKFVQVQTDCLSNGNYDFVKGINAKGNDIWFRNTRIAEYMNYRYDRDGNNLFESLSNEFNAQYHNLSRKSKVESLKNDKQILLHYKVGIEIEKEDYQAKRSIKYAPLHSKHLWCKESDASLCNLTGYELISPIFSLYGKEWKRDLKKKPIKTLIDANYSDRCGGHINLSSGKYNARELYQGLSAFFPLFYSLYERRVGQDYCQAKKVNEMGYEVTKRSAFYIKSDEILEIRIFPAVKNTMNLEWRLDFLKICLENINCSEMDVLRMLVNKKSKLYKHLLVVIDDNKIRAKVLKFINYTKHYNDKNLDTPTNLV